MQRTTRAELVLHRFNGYEEDADNFVEVEGKKYKADPSDKTKPLKDDTGNPVPFEPKNDDGKGKKKDKSETLDPAKASLEDLAKVNPDLAKLLADQSEAQKKEAEAKKKKDEEDRKALEQQNKWKELSDADRKRAEDAEKKAAEMEVLAGKYKDGVKGLLKDIVQHIPEDKRGLIPEGYSPLQRLDYIRQNAKVLSLTGVPLVVGSNVPKNDDTPNLDEEGKLSKQLDDLMKKGKTRTPAEDEQMVQVASKLKEVRKANEQAKQTK